MSIRMIAPLVVALALSLTTAALTACAGSPGAALPSTVPTADPPTQAPAESTVAIRMAQASTPLATAQNNPCDTAPIIVPTAAPDPGYLRLDTSTGLHMTGEMHLLELDTWRLRVTGAVEEPLVLTYDQIRCLPKLSASPDLVCPCAVR